MENYSKIYQEDEKDRVQSISSGERFNESVGIRLEELETQKK